MPYMTELHVQAKQAQRAVRTQHSQARSQGLGCGSLPAVLGQRTSCTTSHAGCRPDLLPGTACQVSNICHSSRGHCIDVVSDETNATQRIILRPDRPASLHTCMSECHTLWCDTACCSCHKRSGCQGLLIAGAQASLFTTSLAASCNAVPVAGVVPGNKKIQLF